MMDYQFRDVLEFQEQYPTKEGREKILQGLDYDEIMHLAHTCGCVAGAVYYERYAWMAADRMLGLEELRI